MKIVFTGSRNFKNYMLVRGVVFSTHHRYNDLVPIHGACPTGSDLFVDQACEMLNIIPIRYKADWSKGKKAGPMRNRKMIEEHNPDCVVAFRAEGKSDGTDGTIEFAVSKGIKVYKYNEKGELEIL